MLLYIVRQVVAAGESTAFSRFRIELDPDPYANAWKVRTRLSGQYGTDAVAGLVISGPRARTATVYLKHPSRRQFRNAGRMPWAGPEDAVQRYADADGIARVIARTDVLR